MPFYEKEGDRWKVIYWGWKDIATACGGVCADTMARVAREYSMPFTRINGRPTITDDELRIWWHKLRFMQGKGPAIARRYGRERNEG